jgi:hypothetical protein
MHPNLSNPLIHLNSYMLVDMWISEHYLCGKIKNNFSTDFVNSLTYPQIHKHGGCSYIFILIIIGTFFITLCLYYSITPYTYPFISQFSNAPQRCNDINNRRLVTNFFSLASTYTLLLKTASFIVTDTRDWLPVAINFISKKLLLIISITYTLKIGFSACS